MATSLDFSTSPGSVIHGSFCLLNSYKVSSYIYSLASAACESKHTFLVIQSICFSLASTGVNCSAVNYIIAATTVVDRTPSILLAVFLALILTRTIRYKGFTFRIIVGKKPYQILRAACTEDFDPAVDSGDLTGG